MTQQLWLSSEQFCAAVKNAVDAQGYRGVVRHIERVEEEPGKFTIESWWIDVQSVNYTAVGHVPLGGLPSKAVDQYVTDLIAACNTKGS